MTDPSESSGPAVADGSDGDPVGAAHACVRTIYHVLLHRDPEPGEHAEWRRMLLNGLTRTTGRPSRHVSRVLAPEHYNPLVIYMLAHYR